MNTAYWEEKCELKVYSGDTLLTTLHNTSKLQSHTEYTDLCFNCVITGESSSWDQTDYVADRNIMPDKVEVLFDGVFMESADMETYPDFFEYDFAAWQKHIDDAYASI